MPAVPLFPLQILPLPGELVPLHIFEPRYRQLLHDAETVDIEFGILLRHPENTRNVGSMVRLERIIRKYPGGESDIVVRCHDFFSLDRYFSVFRDKLYPGGEVRIAGEELNQMTGLPLVLKFSAYLERLKRAHRSGIISVFHIAAAMNLDIKERLAFAELSALRRESYLDSRISYQMKLIDAEERSKDVFHLN